MQLESCFLYFLYFLCFLPFFCSLLLLQLQLLHSLPTTQHDER